jgi:hypothetical protein
MNFEIRCLKYNNVTEEKSGTLTGRNLEVFKINEAA